MKHHFHNWQANISPALICLPLFIILLTQTFGCNRDDKVDKDKVALRRAMRIQELYNLNPGTDILPQIETIADSMRRDGRGPCYFTSLNVIIDRLFSEGRFMEADSLAVRMHEEALETRDSLSIAMSKRVKAQMLYKLSQPERALAELDSALPFLQNPFASAKEFATATSIREWIWIVSRSLGDTARMNLEGLKYADIVDRNTEINNWSDPSKHYPATALSFKSEAICSKGDFEQAKALLDSAASMMLPSLPARAYEHLYEVRARLRAEEGDWAGALADTDTLLATHREFPWFYINDILLKADILNRAGHHEESAATFSRYVAFHDSLYNRITDKRLQDLTRLYRTEIEHEHKTAERVRLVSAGIVIVLLLILLAISLRQASKVKKRNSFLVERIHEFDRTNEHTPNCDEKDDGNLSAMQRLDRYMTSEKPYTNPSLGRKELAEAAGMTQESLGSLIRQERDCSVHSYINFFRLEEVRKEIDTGTNETISDLAKRLGFGTARTLQRAFKERYDMSPTQYKSASSSLKPTD